MINNNVLVLNGDGTGIGGKPSRSAALRPQPAPDRGLRPLGSDRALMPAPAVRSIQAARRLRTALFQEGLFSDPAWDILLELYALHLEQQRTSVSGVCAALSVPLSTSIRWLAKLEADGLVDRTGDHLDGRRSWIALTSDGVDRMRSFFEALPPALIAG